ncbi:hypothetical protein QE429_001402 [Bacillus sp. SORGH_AS 510]|nr:hypothetical protein [Bacillus sp. SORGH_AS_0510]
MVIYAEKRVKSRNSEKIARNKQENSRNKYKIPRNPSTQDPAGNPKNYLNTLKYLASGWANTIADTEASGSIIHPSVS